MSEVINLFDKTKVESEETNMRESLQAMVDESADDIAEYIIIGTDTDGEFFAHASLNVDRKDALWLLTIAAQHATLG